MKIIYAKTLLYGYKHLNELAEQIDIKVEKKALSSMNNITPAINQYNEIIELTFQKDVILSLKEVCDKILKKYSEEDLKFFEYKYFMRKPKSYFKDFDASSRAYFRKQNKLVENFSVSLEKNLVNDQFFEEQVFSIEFFRQLHKQTEEHEKKTVKNRKKTPKQEKA